MTKVLQLCPHDGPPFADLCALYAAALESIECEVTTVYMGSPEREPIADAAYLHGENMIDARAMARLLEDEVGVQFDLAVCHRYRAFKAAAVSGLDNRRCVAVAHEFGMFDRWRRRLFWRVRGAGAVCAGVSPAVREELDARVGRAVLIPNGINLRKLEAGRQPRAEALDALGLQEGGFTVGFVGRLHYKKRPEVAVAAFREFRKTAPEARLVMVGSGELETDVGDDPIHLTGPVADAKYLFNAFDALLMTSTEAEAFGMVALEAMAAGVPVVTARIPGPAYVLDDLGFYADDDSPAAYAAALRAAETCDRETLAASGHARIVREFSVSALARRLDDVCIERGVLA